MEEQKTDPRTLKTKRAIRTAFSKLLSEKSFESITVHDITELAGVNRKTFYRYYKSIPQLVDEIEDNIIRSFDAFLDVTDMIRALENPVIILKHLKSVADFHRQVIAHAERTQTRAAPKVGFRDSPCSFLRTGQSTVLFASR